MVTRTKEDAGKRADVANFGAYPEDYYNSPKTGFLPRAKFMKDDVRAQISRDISKSTAASVAMLEATVTGQPPGPPPPPVAGSGGSGDNGGMEERIKALELDMKDVRERLVRVETKLDNKADKNDITTATLKLVMLGGGALVAVLGVLAKGFGWL